MAPRGAHARESEVNRDNAPSVTPVAEKKEAKDKSTQERVVAGGQVAGTLVEPAKEPEKDSKKPGKLHLNFAKERNEDEIKKYRGILSKAEIKEIRSQQRLLVGQSTSEPEIDQFQNLQKETLGRLQSYTSAYDKNWYTLDYKTLGKDKKGFSHEMNIGLGDILVDPDVKKVLVLKAGSDTPIEGTRKEIVDSHNTKRIGFVDKSDSYIATYTGDKFRILSDEETTGADPAALKTYLAEVGKEDGIRKIGAKLVGGNETEVAEKEDGGEEKGALKKDMADGVTKKSPEKAVKVGGSANVEGRTPVSPKPDAESAPAAKGAPKAVEPVAEKAPEAPQGSIVEKIKFFLDEGQRKMALLIEKIFTERLKKEGLSGDVIRRIIGAAFANSWHESKFHQEAVSGTGKYIGLFQEGPWFGSVKQRKNPEYNINKILDGRMFAKIKNGIRGKTLIERANAGASISELARIFSRDIEAPKNKKGEMTMRANVARKMFGKEYADQTFREEKVAEAPKVEERKTETEKAEVVAKKETPQELTDRKLNLKISRGVCRLKNNQDAWFFGSSSVVNSAQSLGENFGYLGVTAMNSRNFLDKLKTDWLGKIIDAGLKPGEIVLAGMGQNAIHGNADVATTLNEYDQISNLLKAKFPNVVVKFITVNPGRPDKKAAGIARAEFNRELKQKYGGDCIDVATALTEEDGSITKKEYAGGKIHLNSSGRKIWHNIVKSALASEKQVAQK